MQVKYKIYPLKLGSIRRKMSNMAYMKEPDIICDFPIIAWYISDGIHHVLVDTGGSAPDGISYMPYTRCADETMEAALGKLGVHPDQIQTVILTHLHWDHIGNNTAFRNARFYAQRAELQCAVAPYSFQKGQFDTKAIFKTAYEAVDGDCEILPGISVLHTPGHTPGSQSVLVDTSGGRYLLTGDFIALYRCYEDLVPNGIHTDLVVYYEALERIKGMKLEILPGHDKKVFCHQVYPPEGMN